MQQRYTRDELWERVVRAGELEISGEDPDALRGLFAPDFRFYGPGGFESDYDGLAAYFESMREAFSNRSIRRGISVVEGNHVACQTWIELTFSRQFTQSPVGPLPPNGRRIVLDLNHVFVMDDEGRIRENYARGDNLSLLEQLRAPAES